MLLFPAWRVVQYESMVRPAASADLRIGDVSAGGDGKPLGAATRTGLLVPSSAEIAYEPTIAREAAFASWMMVASRAPPA